MNLFQNKIIRSVLGGALGGMFGWMLSEPVALFAFSATTSLSQMLFVDALWGLPIGLGLGLLLGAAEGLSLRSLRTTIRGAIIGMVIGALGGTVGVVIAELVFQQVMWMFCLGRGIGWSVFGLFLGLSEGVRRFSFRGTRNAALGGWIGGFIGGVLFDLAGIFTGFIGGGTLSRAIGLMVLGACIGILIALVERILTEASLVVVQGRQEGRTILLDKPRTTLGRDERNDIYLSDTGIQPRHAEIRAEGGGYTIASTGGAINVNQTPTIQHALQSGDQIDLGGARLVYRTRKRDARAPSPMIPPTSMQPPQLPRAEPHPPAPRLEPRAPAPPAAQAICPRCAHANRAGAKFCQRCGQKM